MYDGYLRRMNATFRLHFLDIVVTYSTDDDVMNDCCSWVELAAAGGDKTNARADHHGALFDGALDLIASYIIFVFFCREGPTFCVKKQL